MKREKNRRQTVLFLVSLILLLCLPRLSPAQVTPYVGSWEVDNLFQYITPAQMDALRTKRILFASRSFGLNLRNGLEDLGNSNAVYDILSDYVRYDVFSAGGDLSVIPADAYDTYNFVHFLATASPQTKRVEELDTLIRAAPHSFSSEIDVAIVYFATGTPDLLTPYSSAMDALQSDFPGIKIIYTTAGFFGASHGAANAQTALFNAGMVSAYKGSAPLYDHGAILSRDGECGNAFCPDYSTDPADVHPNTALGQQQMAKGFLLVLKQAFFGLCCTNTLSPSVPVDLAGTGLSESVIDLSWQASTLAGCGHGVKRYDVMRDDVLIGSTHGTNYTDTGLTELTAYDYKVRAVTIPEVVSVYSAPETVSTPADTTAPTIVSAEDTRYSTQVTIQFSEPLDEGSAETAANYSIDQGISVLSASLALDTVTLATSELSGGTTYTLTVNNVADASIGANPIAANSQATFTYIFSPYPTDPVAYWPFDGSPDDVTTNGLDASWIGAASYGSGLLDWGLALDGTTTGSYVRVAHNALLDGMPALSISMWARKDASGVGGELFKKHALYYMKTGVDFLDGYLFTSGGRLDFSATLTGVNDIDWHHYCMTYDGSYLRTYVDGTRYSNEPHTGNVDTAVRNLYIAKAQFNPAIAFAGDADEVKLFRRGLSSNEVAALTAAGQAGQADWVAVRALLDANGLTNKQVNGVCVFEKDRAVELYIQEGGVTHITSHIGQLSELRLLHCYGDRQLGFPLLTQIAPEIGGCTRLEELLLNQNSLAALPEEITNLTNLNILSVGDNKLCSPSAGVAAWLDTYDPDWRVTQNCSTPGTAVMIKSTGVTRSTRRPVTTALPSRVLPSP